MTTRIAIRAHEFGSYKVVLNAPAGVERNVYGESSVNLVTPATRAHEKAWAHALHDAIVAAQVSP